MRALLVIAAALLMYAAAPADAAPRKAKAPRAALKAKCAAAKAAAKRPTRARRRAAVRRRALLLRRCAALRGSLVGSSRAALIGVPDSFAAPLPFATAAPAAPDAPAYPGAPAPAPATVPEPPGPTLPPIYSNPYAVQVQGFEFGLQLSKAAVSAGNVRVEFNLARAEDPHNLWLVREDGGGSPYVFDEEPSGAVVARTLALTRGRWKLFCSLNGHEAAGMRATLTVN
jgi:hypothetical protein